MPSSPISIKSFDTTPTKLSKEPPAKKAKYTTSDFELPSTVLFVVSEEKRAFQIPQRIMCESSDLIDAEFKDLPGMSVLIKEFPDVSVEVFTLFLVWLSSGDLNNAENFTLTTSFDLENTSKKLGQLIQCYQLSEILISRPFQNYIADKICDFLERLVDMGGLLEKTIICNASMVYAYSPEDSSLKCLLEDAIVTRATNLTRWKPMNTPEVAEFWNGVAIAAIRRMRELEDGRMRFPLNWGEEDRCKYHEHMDDDEVADCRERRLEKAG